MVYLDYAAATPTDEEVLNEFVKATKKYYANPNSNHKLGMEAKDAIDRSTEKIAKNLNVSPEEIISPLLGFWTSFISLLELQPANKIMLKIQTVKIIFFIKSTPFIT